MRPVAALLIWIVLVGGLWAYMNTRGSIREAASFKPTVARGSFQLEVTPTFSAEPDPFALQTDDETKAPALTVRVNGLEVLRLSGDVAEGVPIRVEPLKGLVEGRNELYVEASPPIHAVGKSHAVRVRILRDGEVLASHSFWSEPGSKISTTFPVELETTSGGAAHENGH